MKSWTRETVVELLENNDRAVERAIMVVFNNQTRSEQAAETTLISNGIGFASCDANRGSYYARWIKSGKHLTGSHLENARKMAKKYVRQLLLAIEAK